MTITVRLQPRDLATDLSPAPTTAWDRQFLAEFNKAGSGSLNLQNDDPALANVAAGECFLTFDLDAVPVLTCAVKKTTRRTLDVGEEAEHYVNLSGPGHLERLSEGVVLPTRGYGVQPTEEVRLGDWMSSDMDISGWDFATRIAPVNTDSGTWITTDPGDYPDTELDGSDIPLAGWHWAASGSPLDADPGLCLFAEDVTIDADGLYGIAGAGDNKIIVWIDGIEVIQDFRNFRKTQSYTMSLSAGTHRFASEGENALGPGGNTACIYRTDELGTVGEIVWRMSETTRIYEYPDPDALPGMTAGQFVRLVIEDAQAAGFLPELTLDFDDVNDSAANPWPVGHFAWRVGNDIFTELQALCETDVDILMVPGEWTLRMWRFRERGADNALSFDIGETLTSLGHDTEGTLFTAFLIRWKNGWTAVTTPALAHQRWGFLSLAEVDTVEKAQAKAQAQLDTFAGARTQVTLEIDDDGDHTPFQTFDNGDIVGTPNEALDGEDRIIVLAISYAEDEVGAAIWKPQVGFVHMSPQERLAQAQRRMSPGTAGGRSASANPVLPRVASVALPRLAVAFNFTSDYAGLSTPFDFRDNGSLIREATLAFGDGTGSFDLLLNEVVIASLDPSTPQILLNVRPAAEDQLQGQRTSGDGTAVLTAWIVPA